MCCGILFVIVVVVILPSIYYLVPDVRVELKTTLLMFLVLHYGIEWMTLSLTCAFTQSCFESLQETVQQQFPSGHTGRSSGRTLTLTPPTCRLGRIAAAQQWTHVCLERTFSFS